MHWAPGLAGADRTQKVAIWRAKNRFRGPLAPHRGSEWWKRIPAYTAAPRQTQPGPQGWPVSMGRRRLSFGCQKPVLASVGTLSGSEMAPWPHPEEVNENRDFGGFWHLVDPPGPPSPPQRHGRAGRQLPAGPQHLQAPGIANSAPARFRLQMAGTNTRVSAAPRQMHRVPWLAGADRMQKVPLGGQKPGLGARWHPIGVGYGSLAAPPGSRKFQDLVNLGAWGTPQPPPPPQRDARAGRQHPQEAPGLANSARARVLGSNDGHEYPRIQRLQGKCTGPQGWPVPIGRR
eukprot:gene10573-biopygen255